MNPEMEKRRTELIASMGAKWLLHPSNSPKKTSMIKTSGEGTVAVNESVHWIRIDDVEPPENLKMLLINENYGVACVAYYKTAERQYWTHWQGLPKFQR